MQVDCIFGRQPSQVLDFSQGLKRNAYYV